jgi:magnesium transporter
MCAFERFVVTVRQGAVGELRSVRADLEASPQLLAQGPWAVVHAVYDRVVDADSLMRVEVAAYVEAHADQVDRDGRRLVVRNGYAEPRQVLTSSGRWRWSRHG